MGKRLFQDFIKRFQKSEDNYRKFKYRGEAELRITCNTTKEKIKKNENVEKLDLRK